MYDDLPPLVFVFNHGFNTHVKRKFYMPRVAYMVIDTRNQTNSTNLLEMDTCHLLLHPTNFDPIGQTKKVETWVLGAQFLGNYYTIYNWEENAIGLVESVSSVIDPSDKQPPGKRMINLSRV